MEERSLLGAREQKVSKVRRKAFGREGKEEGQEGQREDSLERLDARLWRGASFSGSPPPSDLRVGDRPFSRFSPFGVFGP